MKMYLLLFGLGTSLMFTTSCQKNYACQCGSTTGPLISYKAGDEKSAKDTCEKAGCKFVEYK